MKFGLFICVLCSWVVVSRAGIAWWGEAPQADQPQQDQANENDGTEVLRMVEALSRDLSDMVGQDDSWLTRYEQVVHIMKENNEVTKELGTISRTALPIIWNVFIGNMIMTFMTQLGEGGGIAFPGGSNLPPPPPHFLMVYPTEGTVDQSFIAQAVVTPTAEANIGFCAYYEPEEGEELDFDNGDIFFGIHFRWHFAYGNSREIAFNDRYNGMWSRPEMTLGDDRWPDITVGEKFIVSVWKFGPCLTTSIILGRDMHSSNPPTWLPATFCPKQSRKGDPRKLWLTVNEDKVGAGEVKVHWLTFVPYTI